MGEEEEVVFGQPWVVLGEVMEEVVGPVGLGIRALFLRNLHSLNPLEQHEASCALQSGNRGN